MKLETKRLILRKPKKSDWKDLLEGVKEREVVVTTENIPHPYKKKDAIWFIEDQIKKWGKTDYSFFIELKSEKKVIGDIHLSSIRKDYLTGTTGSWINKNYWRKGYITEAKIAVNDFAFNKLKLRKINSTVIGTNKASNATQKRMGYKLEGVKRKEIKNKINNKIQDINIYGLLKEDWKKSRKGVIRHLNKKLK